MATKDLNKIMFTGNLGAPPEMRYTPQGSPVTTFRVACGRTWKVNGETRTETEWMNVVAWDKLAEVCNEHLQKGTRVYIEGRLATRSWVDKASGETRYRTEIIAADMIILSPKGAHEPEADSDELYPDAPEPPRSQPATPVQPPAPPAPPTPARPTATPRPAFGGPTRPVGRPAPGARAPEDARPSRPAHLAGEGDADLPF